MQPGWPTNWKAFSPFITYNETDNTCKHCAESTAGICADHTQSPLHLYRNVTATSECLDRHRMNFVGKPLFPNASRCFLLLRYLRYRQRALAAFRNLISRSCLTVCVLTHRSIVMFCPASIFHWDSRFRGYWYSLKLASRVSTPKTESDITPRLSCHMYTLSTTVKNG